MKLSKTFSKILLQSLLLGVSCTVYVTEELVSTTQSHALIEATKSGNLRKTVSLLKAGNVNPDQADSQGHTPLMFAAQQKGWIAPVMISKLLHSGSNLDAQDNEGKTALDHAIIANKPQAVRQLLSKGAKTKPPTSLTIPEKIKKILAQHSARQEKLKTTLIDPISGENIFSLNPSKRIKIGKNTYKKESLFDYILTQIASKTLDQIKDPVSQVPIGREIIRDLATHFNIPITELEDHKALESVQTIEEYITEQYALNEDDSDDEDEIPVERPAPIFEESRKRVFEGIRPTQHAPTETQGFLKQFVSRELLKDFDQMIKEDTLRVLQHRLQKKNDKLLEDLSESDYKHVQSEIRTLERAIKNRIHKFKRAKPAKPTEPTEPFIFFG